jgi:glycosyltransferase involved in cell wall biosynthesis
VRILLVQRSLNPPGGGNAVAAWMVHALAGEHEVATLTESPWDVSRTNAFYGTSILKERVRSLVIPPPLRWLARLPEQRMSRIRMSSVLRYARPLAREYDLLITADNYGAFAKPGIQYLHFPADLHPRPQRLAPIVNLYFALCNRIVGIPWEAARQNVSIVNSQWTADHAGFPVAHVLHPPVVDPGPGLPWERRTDTFLCVGRFHGSKRIETAMTIVQRLRAGALPDARLAIVGSPVDRDYTKRLLRLAARDRHWIDFHQDLSRADLDQLMGRSRFGLQAMVGEHFGMATAEMLRAGCLVFPHRSGGSIEVVNGDERLLWLTEDDAVARIGAVVRNAVATEDLRWQMRQHAGRFSPERFVVQMRGIAEAFYASARNDASAISA